MVNKTQDISKDASVAAIRAGDPWSAALCRGSGEEGGQDSLWDGCAAPHPHPDPHLPVGRAPTSELLHRHVPPRALGQLGRPTEGLNPCQQCVPVQLTITQPQGLKGKQMKPKGRDVKMLKELWLKVRRQTRTFLL